MDAGDTSSYAGPTGTVGCKLTFPSAVKYTVFLRVIRHVTNTPMSNPKMVNTIADTARVIPTAAPVDRRKGGFKSVRKDQWIIPGQTTHEKMSMPSDFGKILGTHTVITNYK